MSVNPKKVASIKLSSGDVDIYMSPCMCPPEKDLCNDNHICIYKKTYWAFRWDMAWYKVNIKSEIDAKLWSLTILPEDSWEDFCCALSVDTENN